MRSSTSLTLMVVILLGMSNSFAATPSRGVQVIADEPRRRVDITIDGKPFTSYIWPVSLKKPTLYPLTTEDGITVTRGYPLDPGPDERVDHPHHAGLWFNYGDVNGFDFWNNSDAIKPEARSKMGTIIHTRVVSTKSGADSGELVVESEWITGTNQKLLTQTTRYVFMRHNHDRVIDLTVTLKALDHITFKDDKEGLLGMRVARWLESPDEKGGTFMDANGNPTEVAAAPAGPNPARGIYLTSDGAEGNAAWGTRGRWCSLTGKIDDRPVTVAIFDQPHNPGYPTYWHARGYGLFAANPLGRSIFDPKQSAFNYALEKGQSVTFRYRVALFSHAVTSAELNHEADEFAAEAR